MASTSFEPLKIVLPFNYVGRNEFQFEVISSFVQHVLYARTLLPMPLNSFRQDVYGLATASKITSSDRKRIKSLDQIESTLSGLLAAVQVFNVVTVAILLGPSANNPKEVYQLHFQFSPDYEATSKSILTERHSNHAKRTMIHKLIEFHASDDTPPSSRQNMFIAFQVVAEDGNIDDNSQRMLVEQDDVLHQDVYKVFSFRDSFKIRTAPTPSAETTTSRVRVVGGKKRQKPLHLHLVSKDAHQQGMEIAATAGIHAVHISEIGADQAVKSAPCASSEPTAGNMMDGVPVGGDDDVGIPTPQEGLSGCRLRWLVQNKGLKGLQS